MSLLLKGNCSSAAMRCRAIGCLKTLSIHSAPHTRGACAAGTVTMQQLLSSKTRTGGFSRLVSIRRPPGWDLKAAAVHAGGAGTASGLRIPSYTTGTAETAMTSGVPYTASYDGPPRVCILGGGFGGLYTAIKLELLMWPKGKKPKITLIDKNDRFVFKPLLYELVNGTAQSWEVAPTFAQLLAPYPIQFMQDKVSEVAPEEMLQDGGSASGGTVRLASGAEVEYDWLVVSLGAAADPRGVPGVREYARPFVTVEDAEFVAQRLADFEARAALGQPAATVVIVGAGYAGVELAAVVGERVKGKARVMVVTPSSDILDAAPAGQREAAAQALRELGVSTITSSKVTAVQQAAVYTPVDPQDPVTTAAAASGASLPSNNQTIIGGNGSGAGTYSSSYTTSAEPSYVVQLEPMSAYSSSPSSQIEADLVLWTAGSKAASQPLEPFPCDSRGQLETDPTLRVVKHSRVFALGDVSKGQPDQQTGDGSSSTSYYPATAQVAFQQADYAAWNIWAAINGRPLLPFRYQHLGDMMSLGTANAAVALPIELPAELTASIATSPFGNLLSLAGLKLGDAQQQQGGVTLEGPLAQLLRRAAYLYRQPTNEQRINVAASWLQQAADAAQRMLAEASSSSAGAGSRR